jgi:hypothetical protein
MLSAMRLRKSQVYSQMSRIYHISFYLRVNWLFWWWINLSKFILSFAGNTADSLRDENTLRNHQISNRPCRYFRVNRSNTVITGSALCCSSK